MLYTYKAKCTRVVDSNIFDLVCELGFDLSKRIRIKLADMDAPEKRAATEAERCHARKAKAFVETLLLDKTVTIRTKKDGERYSAEVILPEGESLVQKLFEADLVKRESY